MPSHPNRPAIFVALNILLSGLVVAACIVSSPKLRAEQPPFDVLFDGQSLKNWSGDSSLWSVEDGAITGRTNSESPIKANTFLIYDGEVTDFEFRCKVRFEGNNSGVQYRSQQVQGSHFALKGYQADLHPKQSYFGMMYGEKTGRGIIAQRGQQVVVGQDGKSEVVGNVGNDTEFVDSEWNDLRIIAVGNRMVHQVNGITTLDLTDNHPDATRSGKLGLQLHQGPAMKVEFRNLLLRKLEGNDALTTVNTALVAPAPQDDSEKVKKAKSKKDSAWLMGQPVPQWIWANESKSNQKVWFRKSFRVSGEVESAELYATCDNHLQIWINDKPIGKSDRWEQPLQLMPTATLKTGQNVIAVAGQNDGGIAALIVKLVIQTKDGKKQSIVTGKDWLHSETEPSNWRTNAFDDQSWKPAKVIQPLGQGPWGIPGYGKSSSDEGTSQDPLHAKNIMAPPGFIVERMHQLTPDQGSWVSMAVDPQGRIYACDQGKAGLYRVTLTDNQPAKIEKVSFGPLENISGAQGLTWAFDSLWFHRSGGNLMRLTDADGDDQLDSVEAYPGTTAGGEHGNHAVILTEDGTGLYLDAGNSSPLAETVASRVPFWSEGLLLPRMWDSNGHARGRMAPGGWITQVDVESKSQTVHAMGFRNQYDIALNRFGDLFTYDADMEWDMGLPWYRPTRICNAVSGADFGWRSGSGKWPTYYEDSLPPVVEIGPGSPTGMVAGTGTQFPTRYQDALFALDWTFGTIYAIHTTPNGAGYQGEAEPFIHSVPLPVTDAVVGADGSLLFAVGGRGTQSALFQVRYVGNEPTAEPEEPNPSDEAVVARSLRRELESFHGIQSGKAIELAWPYLANPDRFIRHAARIAIESQPVDQWARLAMEADDAQTAITSAVALARMGESSQATQLLNNLLRIKAEELDAPKLLGLLRAYALTFTELEGPSKKQRLRIVSQLDPLLPSSNADVNHELIRVLVSLRHPGVVAKTMQLIAQRGEPVMPDWSEVASRNGRYGGSVQRMLDNPPPTQEIAYAFMLRNMREGWSIDLRRDYFGFLNEAAKASGGASYAGYLTRTRDEALATCTDSQRKSLEDITGEDFNPTPKFEIQPIKGPGKAWAVSDVQKANRGKPNFESGRSLYFSAQCAACHRLAGLGGAIGPDLTSVPNKFDDKYLIEAIVHPSRVISDQYGSSTVLLADGEILSGLIVEQPDGNFLVYPNQTLGNGKPIEPVEVDADNIEEITESKVSQMPKELLNNLSGEEVRDLIGYIMSGGDPNNKRYK